MSEAPAWAKGHDLALLREIASLFALQFKPHIYGAFGLPKEAVVADAISDGQAIWTREGGAIAAAALFRASKSASQHIDFAGRAAKPQAGDLVIRSIAGSDSARAKLVAHLSAKTGAGAVWIEDFIESPRAALWKSLGFDHVMTKVAASSDLKAIYHRGDRSRRLPASLSPADRPALSVLAHDWLSPSDRAAALAEAKAYGKWAQHYSTYNKRKSWTAYALRGFDQSDPSFIIKPAEMSKAWRAENPARLKAACGPTPAAAACPFLMAIAARLPGRSQRIRLMRLSKGGGELSRHADIIDLEAGPGDRQVARIHIPLATPPECHFIGWDIEGRKFERHFPAGALCYLDTRKPHSVRNPGAADRIHLVVDQYGSSELRELILAGAATGG